ncbi:MAG: translation elongation factor Ts [Bacillota bacterium]|jgi:elongation factor Ts|nr:translation elongation factor Ts [Bacillota bacterium]HOB91812.1 translation elongation factor Ts [Bacillota bacterium]HPZ53931.1 translation elongation factor Ts [Bacillota bacterium]HQD18129.1 translation elongation factor Ts [Bacillota bacterium]
MTISAEMVKKLRERTGAGMMDCKKALVEAEGDIEKAIVILRERGLAAAAKKAGRTASEGLVDSYIHLGGRVGVLIEVNCETDFVAKTDEFKQLVRDLAMQVAASKPMVVRREEVPAEAIEQEKAVYRAQALNEGKPENVVDKIVEGRLEKFYEQICLLEQPFIKDQDKTVGDLVTEKIALLGENISVRRFARFELGESVEEPIGDPAE